MAKELIIARDWPTDLMLAANEYLFLESKVNSLISQACRCFVVSALIAVAEKTYVPSPLVVVGLGSYGAYPAMKYLNMAKTKVGYHRMVAI